MRNPLILSFSLLLILLPPSQGLAQDEIDAPVYQFDHGRWFDRQTGAFVETTFWTIDGRLTRIRPALVDSIIDLGERFVIPPLGEAHIHDLNRVDGLDERITAYMDRGVFYVMVQDALFHLTPEVRSAVDEETAVDVVYAEGVLVPRWYNLIDDLYLPLAEQGAFGDRRTIEELDTYVLFLIESREDLERKWDQIAAKNSDIVKVIVGFSESYDERLADPVSGAPKPGVDPNLLPEIVERAHATGLRVSVHIETAADFGVAVRSGADIIAHLPGWRIGASAGYARGDLSPWLISAGDARDAAEGDVVVITTSLPKEFLPDDEANRPYFAELHRRNLQLLREHGVTVAIGSDNGEQMVPGELSHLESFDVFDRAELLALAWETTPRFIFPTRDIGRLEEGYEASFLALDKNPLESLDNLGTISLKVKRGRILP